MDKATFIVVLGASPKAERYSNKAVRELKSQGYAVIPVNPGHSEIEGLPAVSSLSMLEPGSVDSVTMYIGPKHSSALLEELLRLNPRRVIFNPGSENPELAETLSQNGIETIEACTLVMLSLGSF
jgi:predicted CoA-binding protein